MNSKIKGIPKGEIIFWSNLLRLGTSAENWEKLNIFAKYFVLVRGVALPITLISAIIGGLFSFLDMLGTQQKFSIYLFLLATFGLLLSHSASNLLNDWWDWKNKVDTPEYFRSKYNIHPVLLIGEKNVLVVAFLNLVLAFLLGLYLTYIRGVYIVILAAVGFLIMFFYSGKPLTLKYRGLGEPIVFLVWGPLMICGVYFVLTGNFSLTSFLVSVPYGLSCTLVLLGKHLDKIDEDTKKKVRTLPVILGEKKTIYLSTTIIIFMHIFALALLFTKEFAIGPLITLFAVPRSARAIRYILFNEKPSFENLPEEYPKDMWPLWYVGGAFIINTYFGTFYILGIIAEIVFKIF